jgi:DNA-binding response OmpR family regulator
METHKIAIIEDEIELLQMLGSMCRDLNLESYEYRTYEDFIFKFSIVKPDLIITDRNLPAASGITLIEAIRKLNQTVPIIMISGSDSKENMLEALNLGASDFISKPFHPEVLGIKIRKFLQPIKKDILIDHTQRLITANDLSVYLTTIEFKIFDCLYKNFEKFVLREDLLSNEHSRSLDVHINKLRKKIKSFNLSIETQRGAGYCLKKIEKVQAAG